MEVVGQFHPIGQAAVVARGLPALLACVPFSGAFPGPQVLLVPCLTPAACVAQCGDGTRLRLASRFRGVHAHACGAVVELMAGD